MNIEILKLATDRKIGYRCWKRLHLGPDIGEVEYGRDQHDPPTNEIWFMWYFHEHRGGMGGLQMTSKKEEIREMVKNLIKHQLEVKERKTNAG